MKWAIGLVVVMIVGCVAAFVVAVGSTRDVVPVDLRSCVRESDATQMRSPGDLGSRTRTDVAAGALRVCGTQSSEEQSAESPVKTG